METLLRYIQMLRFIPKAPESISTPELLKKLQGLGYTVDIRTVQRDLDKLSASGLFPFSNTEDTKPLRWFWPQQAVRVHLPNMTADEALTFKLVEQFLEPMLPQSVKAQLDGYFELADATLKASPLANWLDKLRIVPNNQSLLPAQMDGLILNTVYQALLKNRRLSVNYQARESQPKNYTLNPLGLIFKDSVIYLLATVDEYTDVKQFALQRFLQASLLEVEGIVPKDFFLDDYIAAGEFDYPIYAEHKIQLVLKIKPWVNRHLTETPLSIDQVITPLDNDHFQLHATVNNTQQLRWWLRSFAADIEILAPLSLRQQFAEAAQAVWALYQ